MDKEHFKISITINDSTISYESSTDDLEVDDILSTINTLLKSFFSEKDIHIHFTKRRKIFTKHSFNHYIT